MVIIMKTLAIDIETYSSVDLTKSGVYSYVDAPDFTILLFAYAFDNEEVRIIDLASGEKLPDEILEALYDESIVKTAYNANFECTCLGKYLNKPMIISQWRCSAVAASELGLPQTLELVAKILGLEQQKDTKGKALIKYFSLPCKPTKVNGERTRNLPEHDLDKWNTFKEYCKQDVEVERAIRNKIVNYPIADSEQKLWELDQRINNRGVSIDTEFIEKAIELDRQYSDKCLKRAIELTKLDNPYSVKQLKDWIEKQLNIKIDSLNKEKVKELLSSVTESNVLEVLKLRSEMAKTSVTKYEAMKRCLCCDNKIRGLLQFYGANRTGRWAGRLVQVHNLPQNHIPDIDVVRSIVKDSDIDTCEMLIESIPNTLSELIRTAFIPSKGRRFIVSDFSAIEARVIAWIAGEQWRLDVFKTHGKIYEASASQMFKVPIESIKKGNPLRQKGKIAELALGYGGSTGALITMGAIKMGLEEEELKPLVDAWRNSNKYIVKLWKTIEDAAKRAIKDRPTEIQYRIKFIKEDGILFIRLPSGRKLAYTRPKIEIDHRFNRDCISYEGVNQTTKKWERVATYGGKLTENIIQAIARDCLAEAMLRLDSLGYEIVFHVHDEVILDVEKGVSSYKEVAEIMGQSIKWAKGLPLKADAYETDFYKKD